MIFDISLIEYQRRIGLHYYRDIEPVEETLAIMADSKGLCVPLHSEPRNSNLDNHVVYLSPIVQSTRFLSRRDITYTANEIYDRAMRNEELLEKEFLKVYESSRNRSFMLTQLFNQLVVQVRWEAAYRKLSSVINFTEDMGTMHACCYLFTTAYTKRFTETYEEFTKFIRRIQPQDNSSYRELSYTCYNPKQYQEELLLHTNPVARFAAQQTTMVSIS